MMQSFPYLKDSFKIGQPNDQLLIRSVLYYYLQRMARESQLSLESISASTNLFDRRQQETMDYLSIGSLRTKRRVSSCEEDGRYEDPQSIFALQQLLNKSKTISKLAMNKASHIPWCNFHALYTHRYSQIISSLVYKCLFNKLACILLPLNVSIILEYSCVPKSFNLHRGELLMMNFIDIKHINNKYRLGKKLSEGAFGQIHWATSLQNPNRDPNKDPEFAVKLESLKATSPQLIYECRLYHHLHSDLTANEKGIPMVYYCGVEGQYNALVMELMGSSLQSLYQKCNRKFSLKTVLLLIDQMIQRIQYIHSRQVIHRDIKPDNFCMGQKQTAQRLYLIDFGLAKKYIVRKQHIPYRDGKSLTGTARYASIFTHQGIQQSRRDDLEAIAYVAIYLYKGVLPWQGQKGNNREQKYQRIKDKKLRTTTEQLCRGIPRQFYLYLENVKHLQFEQKPNYEYLKNLFRNLFEKSNFVNDGKFDWDYLTELPPRRN